MAASSRLGVLMKLDKNQRKPRVFKASDLCPYYNRRVHTTNNASSFHISFSFTDVAAHPKAPLCKGGWQKSLISAWGIVFIDTLQSLRHGLRRATSLCTREAFALQ